MLTSLGCAFWHRPNLESPLRRPPFHPTNFLTWLQISDASMLQTLTYGVEKVAGAVKVRAPAMCTVPLTEVQGPDLTFRMCEIFLPAVSHAVPSRYPITPIDA